MSELEKTMAADPKAENTEVERDATAAVEGPAADQPVAQAADTSTVHADKNQETSFEEAVEKSMVQIRNGQLVTGTVVQIVDEEVCVNIGYKSDGIIPKSEFSSDPDVKPSEVLKVGDAVLVEVLKVKDEDGNVLLSRKSVEGKKLWDELMQETGFEDKIYDGVGKEVVKGGIIASIKGVRAFIPASQISTKYVENLNEYVGQPLKLKIIEVDKSRKRIVASQKAVLIAEVEIEKKKKWTQLTVGTKVNGVVRRLTDFGAFVDIGGIDGLVHVTDLTWGRVKHPSDVLKVNQEIEALILNVDLEKERVSLGYKQLQPKPWTKAAENYPIGSVVEGKVVRIVPFGAFVSLEPTIDGLIHISQVSVRRIAKVEDEIKVGDAVRCKVLEVNPEAKRISLSRREVILEENPEIAEELAKEKAERDRVHAERVAQRAAKSEQVKQNDRPERSEGFSEKRGEKPERERRPRREDADYELPPVQQSTTSLADLFSGLTNNEE
jgi:4-hydroxy-3-methylbut-2-enyl diphosphate reductase